ncbi:MAG: ABC-F family ATP-binding cassette domain-containing protein [Spirochaetia bacterium]|jgi:ATP-binding cassette subfamily F protein 3|nr:ABC-F family ATP-binding cassette domain-containing protein [Spirochaetia bacterium]
MINVSNLKVSFGGKILFQNSGFIIRPGDKTGLVGPNGSGKTTVFRILSGQELPDEGSVAIDPGIVTGYFSQEVGEMAGKSALEEALSGAGCLHAIGNELSQIEHILSDSALSPLSEEAMEKIMERYGELQSKYQHLGGYELEANAKTILSGLGIDEKRWDNPVESFSGGWKMRIALAKILLLNPDVLLIDEPTNHLDMESIVWLENWLKSFKGAIVMTSHDRDFMTRICTRTIEAADGSITTYSGNYDFYLKEREIRREQIIASHRRQQAMLAKEEEFIAKFAARASHAAQVQSRIKTIEKIERIVIPAEQRVMKFKFSSVKRSGDIVVSMDNLSKEWELPGIKEACPVFSGITGVVDRCDKIALTGVNGAGKSTLLKVITGQTEATAGSCIIGASVETGYFSQYSCDLLDPEKTIFDEVSGRVPKETIGYIKNLLGAFLFSGDDTEKKIGVLSGGEKTRVMLASLLAQPVNFLVLDEPTNHLDIASREVLLHALKEFEGTVMVVSHDRYFLRSFVNRVFEIDHGALNIYEGDYSYYMDKKKEAEAVLLK